MDTAPFTESLVPPTSGMLVREDTRLEPGVYFLPDGILIDTDNVTLDGNGATLIGDSRRGVGVNVNGHNNVTIRNLRILDFYHGIAVRNASDVTIEKNQITSTAEVEANTIFLDIWMPPEEAYGGGILMVKVNGAEIHDNDLQHQMNGLMTYHCNKLHVRRNNASYSSGFGIHLFHTCDSIFEENWVEYCNRYEPRDKGKAVLGVGAIGHMGADATGFLIVHSSCRNIFRRNSVRMGGDGFFLAGRSAKGEDVGCNDNLFEANDASLSPNIGFESTFSRGNIFRNNWADRGNFGFWLGYSTDTVVEGNRCLLNRQAGVAVEHGVGFKVHNNDFQGNGHGILLWTKYLEDLQADDNCNKTSRDWLIEHNTFYRNGVGIAVRADQDHGIRPAEDSTNSQPELRPTDTVIRHNDIQDNRIGIHLLRADRTTIEKNKINKNVEAEIRREDDRETTLGHNLGMRGAYL